MAQNSFDLSNFAAEISKGIIEDQFDEVVGHFNNLIGIALDSLNYINLNDKNSLIKRVSFIENVLNELWLEKSIEYVNETIKSSQAEFNAFDYLFNRSRYSDRLPLEVRKILEDRNRILAKKKVFSSVLAIIDNEVKIYTRYYASKKVPNPETAARATVNLKYPNFDLQMMYSLKGRKERASFLEAQTFVKGVNPFSLIQISDPLRQQVDNQIKDLQVRAVAATANQQLPRITSIQNVASAWHPVVAESMARIKLQRDFTDNYMKGYSFRINEVFNRTADEFMKGRKLMMTDRKISQLATELSLDYSNTLDAIRDDFNMNQFLSYCKRAGNKYEVTPEALTYLSKFAPMQERRGVFVRRMTSNVGRVGTIDDLEQLVDYAFTRGGAKPKAVFNIHKRLVDYDARSIKQVAELISDQKTGRGAILYLRSARISAFSTLKSAVNELWSLDPTNPRDEKKINSALNRIRKHSLEPKFPPKMNICEHCRKKHGTLITSAVLIGAPLEIPPSHPHCRCVLLKIPFNFVNQVLSLGLSVSGTVSVSQTTQIQTAAQRFLEHLRRNYPSTTMGLSLGGIVSTQGLLYKQAAKPKTEERITPLTILSGVIAGGVLTAGILLAVNLFSPQIRQITGLTDTSSQPKLSNITNSQTIDRFLIEGAQEEVDQAKLMEAVQNIAELNEELELPISESLNEQTNQIFQYLNDEYERWQALKAKIDRNEPLDINELRQLRKADRWIRAFQNAENYREFIYRLNIYEAAVKKIKNFNNREVAEMIQALLDTEQNTEQWRDRLENFISILREDLPDIRFGRANPKQRNLDYLSQLDDIILFNQVNDLLRSDHADVAALEDHGNFINEFLDRIGLEQAPKIRTGRVVNLFGIKNRVNALDILLSRGQQNIEVILENIKGDLATAQVNMISLEKDLNARFVFFSEYRTYLKRLKELLENKNVQLFQQQITQIEELINRINVLYRISSDMILSFDDEIKEVNMMLNNFTKNIPI